MEMNLTNKKKQVIDHPTGSHARVLAVAGSGKTTTMAYLTQALIKKRNVGPEAIRILMFNRLARDQFREKLQKLISQKYHQPQVHTFHSFCYQVIKDAVARNILPEDLVSWTNDKEEMVRWKVQKAIRDLELADYLEPGSVDVDAAMNAISLWKSSLIPPDRAGHRNNQDIALVYKRFEKIRNENAALTYDDFIPIVVALLENEPKIKDMYIGKARVVLVDEYQDVNYGQHKLVELLAGSHADIIVVGDDDQTIYEWRGARPEYILTRFRKEYSTKQIHDYVLSSSFRFGPKLAKAAGTVIKHNQIRAKKDLRSHFQGKHSFIDIIQLDSAYEINRQLADEVISLVKGQSVVPKEIVVLGRMYAQLHGLQSEFLSKGIPFIVLGMDPFYQRHEIQVLISYLRVALDLEVPLTPQTIGYFMHILNSPNRKISRDDTKRLLHRGLTKNYSLEESLNKALSSTVSPFISKQKNRLLGLLSSLKKVHKNIGFSAAKLIEIIVDDVDYFGYFEDYYGEGEESYERKQSILSFISFARHVDLSVDQFINHIENLDTTQGAEEDQIITMTTIFRTKGLEFDYVMIPDCVDGFLPCKYENRYDIFDKKGIIESPESTPRIESERRLFYVAITRARKGVYIGAEEDYKSQFIDELYQRHSYQSSEKAKKRYQAKRKNSPWDDIDY